MNAKNFASVEERTPTPIDEQKVVHMNRDTLYSGGVFDLDAGPVTVTLPDTGKRFMSLQTVTQDHYSPATRCAPVKLTLTRRQIGTRYVALIVRTRVTPTDATDVKAVNALQDAVAIEQPGGPGTWEVPSWDKASRNECGAPRGPAGARRVQRRYPPAPADPRRDVEVPGGPAGQVAGD